jgi:uncharacterized RDD family membrane protein YckC
MSGQDPPPDVFGGINPYAAPTRVDEMPAPPSGATDLYLEEVPEAPLADRGARLLAQFLDGLFMLLCIAPGSLLALSANTQTGAAASGLAMLGVILALGGFGFLLIYQIRLLAREGQTWGKKLMKVRIVLYETGEIPRLGRSLGLRIVVNNLIGSVPCVGPLYGLADPLFIFGQERRCIHDFIAGTKVVEAS